MSDESRPNDDGPGNFIAEIVDADLASGKHGGRVVTRFPPEPNGYLHVGHAKAICLNFSMAAKGAPGYCNLRFDDTNPAKEEVEYVEAIKRDIRWLGFDWEDREYYASDYFDQLYAWAIDLVKAGRAYVDSQTEEEIRQNRGDFYRKGVNSRFRDRKVEENLDLLARMKAGEFEDGTHVLRAKIDMESADLKLRDPLMYRIRRMHHYRTGDKWCIYPMYDYAHGLSDAIERVTHSLCSLEFENHRPLYDWFVNAVGIKEPPRQIEFAKLRLTYTVMSKRWLLQLVNSKVVCGWDDPRMPTLSGMRRRGYSPEAIRVFCDRVGVNKRDSLVDLSLLDHALREDLNARSPRFMGVLRPLRVVLENFPEGETEYFDVQNHPEYPDRGTRRVPFSRVLFIERDDFMETPIKGWFRLSTGGEVRLRNACIIRCKEAIKDEKGEITELRCTWDPDSRGGTPKDGRKVKGTLHWVSAPHARDCEVRLYDRLFTVEEPMNEEGELTQYLNPNALEVLQGCKVEPALAEQPVGFQCQFERIGYFCVDPDTRSDRIVANRTIGLRDSWAKAGR